LQCEVCGRHITGKPFKAIIEGARLVVCSECAPLGSLSWELKTPQPAKPTVKPQKPQRWQKRAAVKPSSPLETTLELIEDFGNRIRQARETQRLSHEDLGRKINEKVSLLKKLESQKMKPDNRLAEKLQHTLKIKILIPPSEEKLPKSLLTTTPPSRTVTLGDLIQDKKKQLEETK